MKNISKKYVIDTSAIIEKIPSSKIKNKEITSGVILIPHAVLAELENQANRGKEIGLIGLEEIQELRELCKTKLSLEFVGERPSDHQIKHAKSGEIDAYIRGLAGENHATLITADVVQAESAKALGIPVDFIKVVKYQEELSLQKYIDSTTMSLHIKEGNPILAKKGSPGNWKLEKVTQKNLKGEEVQDFAKEIIEKTNLDRGSYTEISRRCTTVVQYKNLRIVMVKPPVSDGWEITIVHPIKKLDIDEYNLPKDLAERIEYKARGIVICGETGSGKTTLAQAIAEWYDKNNRIVKTVESPRDLQLPDSVTQYSKNFTEPGEMHDILFLSRPDNILFDEMRSTPDFQLYTDLRLAGSNMIGVLHASQAIDAVQRFISRLDLGVLPNVVDTIIFMQSGKVEKVLTLKMLVKVPSGMTESDLARPVIEVRDHTTNDLDYEVYSYGEQTVVIPVTQTKTSGALKLAEREIENYFRRITHSVKAEVISPNKVIVYVPEENIAKIIGQAGKNIEKCEEDLGMSIDIRELVEEKQQIKFQVNEDKKNIIICTEPGKTIEIHANNRFIASAISSKKGEVRFNKKSAQGRDILKALNKNGKLEVKA
ncbi:MAG: PINc/VapC family ATPase [Nanoarchaeota archaeon]|nr:PINc/VapC family ATPase [Nanoarchaeota archaeon]